MLFGLFAEPAQIVRRAPSPSACARVCKLSRVWARSPPKFVGVHEQAVVANRFTSPQIEQLEAEKKKLHAQVQDNRALYDAIEKVNL